MCCVSRNTTALITPRMWSSGHDPNKILCGLPRPLGRKSAIIKCSNYFHNEKRRVCCIYIQWPCDSLHCNFILLLRFERFIFCLYYSPLVPFHEKPNDFTNISGRKYSSVRKVSDILFLQKPGGFQWSVLAWGDLEPSYRSVNFFLPVNSIIWWQAAFEWGSV